MNSEQQNAMQLKPGAQKSRIKLAFAAAAVAVMITIGVVSGLVPRLRQHTELRAETREISIPTVSVVSPKPGQPSSGMPLPAEIKPQVEAPIYARANGY